MICRCRYRGRESWERLGDVGAVLLRRFQGFADLIAVAEEVGRRGRAAKEDGLRRRAINQKCLERGV
jgi:hypothetical protein